MRAVNLLPKDDHRRSQRPQNLPAVVSTAVVVAVVGLVGVMYFSAKSTSAAAELELQDAKAELALLPTPAELEARTAPQRKLAGERDARVSALSTALGHRIAWDRVLRQISLVLPEDVWLKSFIATSPVPAATTAPSTSAPGSPPTLMTIEGYTYSHDAVARLLTRLSVIPDLKNVWLQKSQRTNLGGRSVVTFTILADVRPGARSS
jgi:Tfp pilus assembly protein PilN